jgi:GTP-binding protein HflX
MNNEINNNELEKAVLVAVNSGDTELFNYQLEELKNLCEACQVEVVGTITQRLSSTHPAFYVNRGKLDEIKNMVNATDAEVVIFNGELSPSQIGNIEEIVDTRIIDRTMLILDIFDRRARTKEAQLQVSIATARYMMPRLIGSRKYLSRLGGGGGGAAGARRGAGETKLELDRRHLGDQIVRMKTELEELVKSRETSRKMRQDKQIPVVALVGYTNSGKSSTLNAIMHFVENENEDKNVYVEDMLFATLETATRRIKLPSNKEFLLTDTVGFVSKLPHHLVESFKSTLEEIKEASLIIHIVDASSPFLDLQVKTTKEVLAELGVENVKTLYAFNKIDLAKDFIIPAEYKDALKVSATTLEGYPELTSWIENELFGDYKEYTLNIPYAKGDIFSYLKENTEVTATEYQEQGIKVTTRLSSKLANLYREYIA